MMDRLPPIYSAIASQQAKFEAENMDNLKVLMRVNEMQQQRERQGQEQQQRRPVEYHQELVRGRAPPS